MKMLVARETDMAYHFEVHLDETKLDKNGDPNKNYVVSYDWSKQIPDGLTESVYLVNIKKEIKLLSQLELSKRIVGVGTKLAGEGASI